VLQIHVSLVMPGHIGTAIAKKGGATVGPDGKWDFTPDVGRMRKVCAISELCVQLLLATAHGLASAAWLGMGVHILQVCARGCVVAWVTGLGAPLPE
jgi:hypothetical protein